MATQPSSAIHTSRQPTAWPRPQLSIQPELRYQACVALKWLKLDQPGDGNHDCSILVFCNIFSWDVFFHQLPASLSLSPSFFLCSGWQLEHFHGSSSFSIISAWKTVATSPNTSTQVFEWLLHLEVWGSVHWLWKMVKICLKKTWLIATHMTSSLPPWYPCQSHKIAITTDSIAESFNFFLHISRNLGGEESRRKTTKSSQFENSWT